MIVDPVLSPTPTSRVSDRAAANSETEMAYSGASVGRPHRYPQVVGEHIKTLLARLTAKGFYQLLIRPVKPTIMFDLTAFLTYRGTRLFFVVVTLAFRTEGLGSLGDMIRLEKSSRTSKVWAWACVLNRPTGGVSPASKGTRGSRESGLRCFNFRRRECRSPDFRLPLL